MVLVVLGDVKIKIMIKRRKLLFFCCNEFISDICIGCSECRCSVSIWFKVDFYFDVECCVVVFLDWLFVVGV